MSDISKAAIILNSDSSLYKGKQDYMDIGGFTIINSNRQSVKTLKMWQIKQGVSEAMHTAPAMKMAQRLREKLEARKAK